MILCTLINRPIICLNSIEGLVQDKPAEAVGGFFPGVPGQPRARDRSPKTPIVFGDLYYQMGSGERGAALGGEANKNHKGEDDVLQCVDDIRDILGEGEVLVSSDDAANTSAREDGEAEDDTMGITTSLVLDPTSSTDHQRAAEQELDPSSSSFYHYNQQMNGVSKQQPRPWSKGSSTSNKGAGAMPKGKGVELAIDVGLAERGPGNPDRMLSGTGGGEFSVRNRISPSGSDVLPPPSRGHQHPQGGSGGGAVRPEDRDRGDEYDPFAESLEMEDVRGGEVEGGTGGNKS
eukprot:g11134.t1